MMRRMKPLRWAGDVRAAVSAGCLGERAAALPNLGQGFLGRGKGIHVLVGLLPYGGICYQQHADR